MTKVLRITVLNVYAYVYTLLLDHPGQASPATDDDDATVANIPRTLLVVRHSLVVSRPLLVDTGDDVWGTFHPPYNSLIGDDTVPATLTYIFEDWGEPRPKLDCER